MIKPVEQSIPTPLKQAISLTDKYDTYVETSIRDTIKKGELCFAASRRLVALRKRDLQDYTIDLSLRLVWTCELLG